MPKVKVDGIEIEVPQAATVVQACEPANKDISCQPRRLAVVEG